MRRRTLAHSALAGALSVMVSMSTALAAADGEFALGTAFTYQGRLERGGRPAAGRFDLSFELFDAREGGRSFGRVDRFDVDVRDGAFAVELDFGDAVHTLDSAWLAVDVRPAGEGAYTPLAPRHRLAGEGLGVCTVDSDVLIHGALTVDPPATTGVAVTCCNDLTLTTGGQVRLNGFLGDLALDDDEIQARVLGSGGQLLINREGGSVGIGVTAASAPLHLPAAPDVTPGSGGVLVLGPTSGANLALDGNELMARNNGATAPLTLNANGGAIEFGGPARIGYAYVTSEVFSAGSVTVHCPPDLEVLGGGCYTADSDSSPDALVWSYPTQSPGGWVCLYDSDDIGLVRAYAICADVQ